MERKSLSLSYFLVILALITFDSTLGLAQTKRKISQIEEELRKEEEKFLKELKKEDPRMYKEMYKEMLKRREAEKKKRQIRESYLQGKISFEEAKAALEPLIKKEVDLNHFLEGIDEQIKMLEEEIARLRRIKRNPSLLIEEQIERYLR